GDFSIPYFAPTAEVLRASGSSVTFRGYLYRIESDSCDVCDDRYVPLAPSNVRFGFTVMGLVDRPPTLSVSRPAANEAGDPGALTVFAPGTGELCVLDASGRVVRRIATPGGTARWDGHDEHGTTAPAGIYWVRWTGPAGTVTKRVVKLGR